MAVLGYFDPLQAEHVRRLKEISAPGSHLVAVVADPQNPYLNRRARAELVAALSVVNCVVEAEGDPARVLAELQPDDVVREEATDLKRREALVQHVLARHQIA